MAISKDTKLKMFKGYSPREPMGLVHVLFETCFTVISIFETHVTNGEQIMVMYAGKPDYSYYAGTPQQIKEELAKDPRYGSEEMTDGERQEGIKSMESVKKTLIKLKKSFIE